VAKISPAEIDDQEGGGELTAVKHKNSYKRCITFAQPEFWPCSQCC
jgi:hypothetical protein